MEEDSGKMVSYLKDEEVKIVWSEDDADAAALKTALLDCGLSSQRLVLTAWGSASTFRGTDKRGGSDGARIRLEPQCNWDVNEPEALQEDLKRIGEVMRSFNDA